RVAIPAIQPQPRHVMLMAEGHLLLHRDVCVRGIRRPVNEINTAPKDEKTEEPADERYCCWSFRKSGPYASPSAPIIGPACSWPWSVPFSRRPVDAGIVNDLQSPKPERRVKTRTAPPVAKLGYTPTISEGQIERVESRPLKSTAIGSPFLFPVLNPDPGTSPSPRCEIGHEVFRRYGPGGYARCSS